MVHLKVEQQLNRIPAVNTFIFTLKYIKAGIRD